MFFCACPADHEINLQLAALLCWGEATVKSEAPREVPKKKSMRKSDEECNTCSDLEVVVSPARTMSRLYAFFVDFHLYNSMY